MAKLRDGRLGVSNFEEKYTRCSVTDNVPIEVFKLMADYIHVDTKYLENVTTEESYSVSYQM